MKTRVSLIVLFLVVVSSCDLPDPEAAAADAEVRQRMDEEIQEEKQGSEEISLEVHMGELYGDWVLIGVGADRMGPGVAPAGEILFAFRENGSMTVATEGEEELRENLAGIPSSYELDGTKMCSDDILFKLQFKQECCEIIRLDEGRMSVKIQIPSGDFIYKHFVKLEA